MKIISFPLPYSVNLVICQFSNLVWFPPMLRLFVTHSLRYFARHPVLTALNVLGIALGVTVFLSVQIVNHSALESFRASVDIVSGKADLEVIGDGLQFDENAYPIVANDPDVVAATPSVDDV